MLYELSEPTTETKLDELNARFRNHTMALFEKHGMTNIMYWTPVDKPNMLIYVIAHKDKAAADASWAAFVRSVWLKVAETQKNGKIVERRIRLHARNGLFADEVDGDSSIRNDQPERRPGDC